MEVLQRGVVQSGYFENVVASLGVAQYGLYKKWFVEKGFFSGNGVAPAVTCRQKRFILNPFPTSFCSILIFFSLYISNSSWKIEQTRTGLYIRHLKHQIYNISDISCW